MILSRYLSCGGFAGAGCKFRTFLGRSFRVGGKGGVAGLLGNFLGRSGHTPAGKGAGAGYSYRLFQSARLTHLGIGIPD